MNDIIYSRDDIIPPIEIIEYAWELYDENFDPMFKKEHSLTQMFSWTDTPEKYNFWNNIFEGNFKPFYEKYPEKKSTDAFSII